MIPGQRALTMRRFGGTLRPVLSIFFLDRGAAIKTLLVVAVIAVLYGPVSLTTRLSMAGTVNDAGDAVDSRGGTTADAPLSGFDDVDPPQLSSHDLSGSAKKFGSERSRDMAAGFALPIHGIAFTFDSAVAKSFWMELATNAGTEEDDLPASAADGNPALPGRKVTKVSAHFNEHVKSVAESKFQSSNSAYLNDWDLRDFRPPEWMIKLRQMVRDGAPAQQGGSTSGYSSGSYGYSYGTSSASGAADAADEPQPDVEDSRMWIVRGINIFMAVQKKLEELDPMTLFFIGIVIFPFVLIGIAWKMRDRVSPDAGTPRRRIRSSGTSRPPTRVRGRVRRHRKRSESLRVKPGLQS